MKITELKTTEEMLLHIDIMKFLYPELTLENYKNFLPEMIKKGYSQIIIENEEGLVVGISGLWKNIKIWTGPYLEIDNFVIHPEFRNIQLGKMLSDYITEKAQKLNVSAIVLDAFVENFGSHKFYYNQGYVARGKHFVKFIK